MNLLIYLLVLFRVDWNVFIHSLSLSPSLPDSSFAILINCIDSRWMHCLKLDSWWLSFIHLVLLLNIYREAIEMGFDMKTMIGNGREMKIMMHSIDIKCNIWIDSVRVISLYISVRFDSLRTKMAVNWSKWNAFENSFMFHRFITYFIFYFRLHRLLCGRAMNIM